MNSIRPVERFYARPIILFFAILFLASINSFGQKTQNPGPNAAPPALYKPLKIAVIDLDHVVTASTPGRLLQARLDKFQQTVRKEGEKMSQEADKIRKKIAAGSNSLSKTQLNALQASLEDKQIELRRFRDRKQREGKRIQSTGLQTIERQLRPVMNKLRDSDGYELIINNVPGVVMMATARADITKLVIERLNAAVASTGK